VEFQLLYLELVDSTNAIRSLLSGITQEDAQFKPSKESWSILETLCHLYDEEREDFRARLDATLHRVNDAWKPIDPEGWVVTRKYNEQDFATIKERFLAERSRSLDWLKGLENSNWNSTHDADFGRISAGDLFASWIAHDNLAIRQLVELRRARLEKLARPYAIAYAGEW
jgi:hypothetical protein